MSGAAAKPTPEDPQDTLPPPGPVADAPAPAAPAADAPALAAADETLPPPAAAEELPETRIEAPLAGGVALAPVEAPLEGELGPGSVLGDFELVRELGRGGMGRVFLARERGLGREVALKVLSRDEATPELLQRFEVEAQTAARLRHPGIVSVHRVGEASGRPFIAMDYVAGESLQERLQRAPLEPSAAAVLGRDLAAALAYAHGRAVLHRDLKPGNVLLDREGRPALADFGLAKDVAGGAELTRSGQVLGTPSYMPPEQAAGRLDLVDRRSDVYSLGATLYAALTGRAPFVGANALNVLNAVLHAEPPRPGDLRPGLPRDLETICLTCLAKEPGERYASAQELCDDLGRFLGHEPIRARRPSLPERAAKWVRRNRALAAGVGGTAALAVAVLLLAAWARAREVEASNLALETTVSDLQDRERELQAATAAAERQTAQVRRQADELGRQAEELRRERGATQRQRDLALERERVARGALSELTSGLLDRGWDRVDPALRTLREQLLDKTIERYEALLRLDSEHGVELDHERAEAIREAAEHALTAGRLEPARRLLERAATSLRGLRRGGTAPLVSELVVLDSLAPTLIRLSEVHRRQGKHQASAVASAEAVACSRQALAASPESNDARRWLAQSLDRLAESHDALGEAAAARASFEEAVRVARDLVAREPKAISSVMCLQHALYHMGDLHRAAGELPQSEAAFAESAALLARIEQDDPHSLALRQMSSLTLRGLAHTRRALGRADDARQAFEQAVALARRLLAHDPGHAVLRGDLSLALCELAESYLEADQLERALLHYQEAIAIRRALAADDATDRISRDVLFRALARAAELLRAAGRPADALAALLEAEPLLRQLAQGAEGEEAEQLHRSRFGLLGQVGELRRDLGDLEGAVHALTEALQLQRGLAAHAPGAAQEQRQLVRVLIDLAQVQLRRQDFEEARVLAAEAVQLTRANLAAAPQEADRRRQVSVALGALAKIHWRAGQGPAALRAYEEATANHRELVAQDEAFQAELERLREATQEMRTQVALLEGKRQPASPEEWLLLARARLEMRRFAEAAPAFARALESPELRSDLGSGNLYDAACAAARAAAAAPAEGPARAALRTQALDWLRQDLALRRDVLAKVRAALAGGLAPVEREQAEAVQRRLTDHVRYAKDDDPDLASLRALPEFRQLFAE
ncbi:MAG: protein kinase [Planctomycetota bacterium]